MFRKIVRYLEGVIVIFYIVKEVAVQSQRSYKLFRESTISRTIMIMRNLIYMITVFLTFFTVAENANILAILPMVQKSHYVMYKRLLEELVKRGHTVDVLGGVALPSNDNNTGLNIIEFPTLEPPDDAAPYFTINDLREFTVNFAVKFMFHYHGTPMCKESFELDVMKNLRDSKKKYDLLLIEIFICDCFFGFAHTFKIPVVSLISSTDLPWGGYRIGNPDNPSYIPVYFQDYRPHKLLFDRFWNTISYIQTKAGHWWYTREQDKISRAFFGEDMPHLDDIIANTSIILLNSHFTINMARPAVPNFIEVGGLHISDTIKPLSTKITNFIGKEKFIYFSLGTLAPSETFKPEILKVFMDTFAELDYKILWKANGTEMEKKIKIPSNVLIHSWMPQLEILSHPNILFFITHSGLMGTQEAIHCGVPMLCLPLFADQYQNCRNMVDREVAKTLVIETVTKDELKNTITELVENPRYTQNAKRLSAQFKDRPMSPMDTAIYWINYVIEHKGAPHMKSPSIQLKWYQYYLIDVFSIMILSLLLCILAVYVSVKYLIGKLQNSSKKKKTQ